MVDQQNVEYLTGFLEYQPYTFNCVETPRLYTCMLT